MHLLNSYIEIGGRYAFSVNVPRPAFSGVITGTVIQKQMIDGVLYVMFENHKGLNMVHVSKCERIG